MKLGAILIMTMVAISSNGFGQLRVHSNGAVSIGTLSSSGYTCTIAGYSGLKLVDGSSYIRFTPSTAQGIIGSQSNNIYLWTNESIAYNDLHIEDLAEGSDSTTKTNITKLESGLETVLLLEPKSYNRIMDSTGTAERNVSYGFLAQDVQEINPNLVVYGMDSALLLHTTQIIPFLVLGVQQQQVMIDSLSNHITKLENALYNGGIDGETAGIMTNQSGELIELGQNNPNPFKESTSIPYNIPATTKSAQIIVYNMRGEQLKAYPISNFGEGQLIIEGSTFKAGMYMYALIVDGQFIDSKKMILSK